MFIFYLLFSFRIKLYFRHKLSLIVFVFFALQMIMHDFFIFECFPANLTLKFFYNDFLKISTLQIFFFFLSILFSNIFFVSSEFFLLFKSFSLFFLFDYSPFLFFLSNLLCFKLLVSGIPLFHVFH